MYVYVYVCEFGGSCLYINHIHHRILTPALSLPLGKTTVMHMIIKERLPDEQNTGESVHHW